MGKKMYRATVHTVTTVLTLVTTSASCEEEAVAKIEDGDYVTGKRRERIFGPRVIDGPHIVVENLPLFKDKKKHGSAQRRKQQAGKKRR